MKNQYKIDGNILVVYNRKDNKEMLFDAEDFNLISQYTWYIDGSKYVKTNIRDVNTKKYKPVFAHRLVMNSPDNLMIDHINGNGLNNCKINLRTVTQQINNHNQKNRKGYYWNTQRNRWRAHIMLNNKSIYLGQYKTELEARQAYLEAKKIYHPTAPINHI